MFIVKAICTRKNRNTHTTEYKKIVEANWELNKPVKSANAVYFLLEIMDKIKNLLNAN